MLPSTCIYEEGEEFMKTNMCANTTCFYFSFTSRDYCCRQWRTSA